MPDQTTLLRNEQESFALAPVDASAVRADGFVRTKRKRKLIVDEVKAISGEEMKAQLSDTQVNEGPLIIYEYCTGVLLFPMVSLNRTL